MVKDQVKTYENQDRFVRFMQPFHTINRVVVRADNFVNDDLRSKIAL